MSLFGGIDLGTPASRNASVLTRELESRRKRYDGPGRIYRGDGDFLLRHGRFYPGRDLPERYAHLRGRMNECWWNAMNACEADPSLRYCEGLAGTGSGHFVAHAWCLDPEDGVVEVTYPAEVIGMVTKEGLPVMPTRHWSYWGAIFTVELARQHDALDIHPMLGRANFETLGATIDVTPPDKVPLLDVPYDPDRKELP